jgi:hypothetical protein
MATTWPPLPTRISGPRAWQHASSLAALRLTTEALITELPAKNEKAPTTHPGGGDDGAGSGAASGFREPLILAAKSTMTGRLPHTRGR